MNPTDKYQNRVAQANSLLCIGLDSDIRQIPRHYRDDPFPQFAFNRVIIEETRDYVCAYKMNSALYEARGDRGMAELKMTVSYLQERHPNIVTICDAKRADIGSTNMGYVEAIYDWLGFDSVTLHPYLGKQALQPFLQRSDKYAIVVCRTANPGARELQDLQVDGIPLWLHIADRVAQDWNSRGNCMLVVGAAEPGELRAVRERVGDMPLFVPGVGAQAGSVQQVVEAGINTQRSGVIINAARSIIFSEEPWRAARKLRDEINQYRFRSDSNG
jgi:orotidine-5'-phosphate decarboxylase